MIVKCKGCGAPLVDNPLMVSLPNCCYQKLKKEVKGLKTELKNIRKAMERMGGGSVKRGPESAVNKRQRKGKDFLG